MPTRLQTALIVVFWLATTGFVVKRDVWPRYFGDAPPAVGIDLADEATQLAPTNWLILRQEKEVGTLRATMRYLAEDDTFAFDNRYSELRLDLSQGLTLVVPQLTTTVRVTRAGDLREQSLAGEFAVQLNGVELGRARAEVTGAVTGGQLLSHCRVFAPPGATQPVVDRDLDPVPVPNGQVLNPLMPVNRLRGVEPGRRWVIQSVDPLGDAALLFARELGKDSALVKLIPAPEPRVLIAEVLSEPETITPINGEPTRCRVIRYRGTTDGDSRTWVSIADDRVLRQEAALSGDSIRFERVE